MRYINNLGLCRSHYNSPNYNNVCYRLKSDYSTLVISQSEITMTESKTAMRTADNTPVFVKQNGEYAERFPRENVIRRTDSDERQYVVYGFVGTENDYEEQSWTFDQERDALQYATMIYGNSNNSFDRSGEVYEVEVHEVEKDTVEPTV